MCEECVKSVYDQIHGCDTRTMPRHFNCIYALFKVRDRRRLEGIPCCSNIWIPSSDRSRPRGTSA